MLIRLHKHPYVVRCTFHLFACILLAGCTRPADHEQYVTVFAAASLTDALSAVADSFEAAYPSYHVVLNVAATSLLARQIEQGAPADVFFSANQAWMVWLEERGLVADSVVSPLGNRLVVVGRRDAPALASLKALGEVERVALADPEHVPAGLYAREGLMCAGLWTQVQPRVVPTLDVRAALLAVRNAAADVAIVYASDVTADPNLRVVLAWPAACQPDIRYTATRLQGAPHPDAAARFLAFATDSARASLWERFGFLPR